VPAARMSRGWEDRHPGPTRDNGGSRIGNMKLLAIKLLITLGAVALIVIHAVLPQLQIDAITLGLALTAVTPWVSSVFKKLEFPGGWKVEFQELKEAGDKVTAGAPVPIVSSAEFAYVDIASKDPNLALVGLRIEIERRIRQLADRFQLPPGIPLRRMLDDLRRAGVLNDSSISGLEELVRAGNQAAHGAKVDPAAASWAIDYGPRVLAALDAKLVDVRERHANERLP
jgi:hypothetical protein